MAGRGTPANALLAARGVKHQTHTYQHNPRHESFGLEAAQALDVAPERVFKTLIAQVDGELTVGIVPVTRQLDLKALAAALGGKKAVMAEVSAAQRATGYVAGGISPLGQRKALRTVLDSSAAQFGTLYCSGGRRGLEIELAPDDLAQLTNAIIAPISV